MKSSIRICRGVMICSVIAFLTLSLISAAKWAISRTNGANAVSEVQSVTDLYDPQFLQYDIHDLCQEDAYVYYEEAGHSDSLWIPRHFKTNSTAISVSNTGDVPVFLSLYDYKDLDSPIMTATVKPGESAEFTMLTSATLYTVEAESDSENTISLTFDC